MVAVCREGKLAGLFSQAKGEQAFFETAARTLVYQRCFGQTRRFLGVAKAMSIALIAVISGFNT
mgnify:FL=1